jgi:hypothetical protein
MTQEEIQERNKEIVLMLGWKKTSAHKRDQYGYYQPVVGYSTPYRNTLDTQAVEYQFDKNAFATGDLQFHSDWNWLMESVEFIHKKYHTIISVNHCEIHTYENDKKSINVGANNTKLATFIAVSDFAKLYNEGKL